MSDYVPGDEKVYEAFIEAGLTDNVIAIYRRVYEWDVFGQRWVEVEMYDHPQQQIPALSGGQFTRLDGLGDDG